MAESDKNLGLPFPASESSFGLGAPQEPQTPASTRPEDAGRPLDRKPFLPPWY